MSLDIAIVNQPDEIAVCLALRRAVFVDEQGVPESDEIDGQDAHCVHVLVRIDGDPVGAARFHYLGDVVKIQRVCIALSHRGAGVGARLIEFITGRLEAEGRAGDISLDAQTRSLDFYRKLGFEVSGPEFLDAGIPHRAMKKRLAD